MIFNDFKYSITLFKCSLKIYIRNLCCLQLCLVLLIKYGRYLHINRDYFLKVNLRRITTRSKGVHTFSDIDK